MTLYSSGFFSVWPASGCIDNLSRLPASPWLPDEKTLAFGTTIHFDIDSKLTVQQSKANYKYSIFAVKSCFFLFFK